LAVGILILTVTPRRHDAPIAISATTTPTSVTAQVADADDVRRASSIPGFAARGAVTTHLAAMQHALATPIGDGRLALVTSDALISQDAEQVEVRLPSGRLAQGHVVERSGEAWVIELQQPESGHDIAIERPSGSEIVTGMESPPITVAFADISTLEIDEGTAVLDDKGDLVGICTKRSSDGKVRLIEVRSELSDATTSGP
jgi:hypothetical protein